MKEGVWGYWVILIGLFVIVVLMLLTNYTTTNEQDYYLIKEVTESAMADSIDIPHYRKYGEIRIVKEKFVEDWVRRFSETINVNKSYNIKFYDIYEAPPKVSVQVTTKTDSIQVMGDSTNLDVVNRVDAILEVATKPGSDRIVINSNSDGSNSSNVTVPSSNVSNEISNGNNVITTKKNDIKTTSKNNGTTVKTTTTVLTPTTDNPTIRTGTIDSGSLSTLVYSEGTASTSSTKINVSHHLNSPSQTLVNSAKVSGTNFKMNVNDYSYVIDKIEYIRGFNTASNDDLINYENLYYAVFNVKLDNYKNCFYSNGSRKENVGTLKNVKFSSDKSSGLVKYTGDIKTKCKKPFSLEGEKRCTASGDQCGYGIIYKVTWKYAKKSSTAANTSNSYNKNFYIKNGSKLVSGSLNYSCGDKLFITSCKASGSDKICTITKVNDVAISSSATIKYSSLVSNFADAKCSLPIKRYITSSKTAYYYTDSSLSKGKTKIACGAQIDFYNNVSESCSYSSNTVCKAKYGSKEVYVLRSTLTTTKPTNCSTKSTTKKTTTKSTTKQSTNVDTIKDYRYFTTTDSSNGYQVNCGDKLYLTTCTNSGNKTCKVTKVNGVSVNKLTNNKVSYFTLPRTKMSDEPKTPSKCNTLINSAGWSYYKGKLNSSASSSDGKGPSVSYGTPFRIVGTSGNYLKVKLNDGNTGWLNKKYVLINAMDYIPALKANITGGCGTNGVSCGLDLSITPYTKDGSSLTSNGNVFTVAGYKYNSNSIKYGQILYNLGAAYNSKLGRKEEIVPIRFALADPLATAQYNALKKGYYIVIYDAYRPYSVTKILRDSLDYMIKNSSHKSEINSALNAKGYSKGDFIAQGRSHHNAGTAVDMSLTSNSLKDVKTSSKIDEISTYAVTNLNVSGDKLINSIMTSAGLVNLKSEWWHYELSNAFDYLNLYNKDSQPDFQITSYPK